MKFTQMISSLLVAITFMACTDDRGWTAEIYSAVVKNCKDGFTTGTDAEKQKFCDCYFTKVKERYTYDEYTRNFDAIDQQLERDGTAQACEL